jgi:hypothetical protein
LTIEEEDAGEGFRLDVVVEASGFGQREMKALEQVCYGRH